MQNIITSRFFYLMFTALSIYGCVEPIEIDESLNFEKAIIIEATITNEFKHQEILLSNSYSFEENGPTAETNATVEINVDNQFKYFFEESSPGKYISVNKFSVEPNKNYQLSIITSQGKSYLSNNIQMPNSSQIDNLKAIREIDNFGNDQVSILVNSFNPNDNSKYYRYEYEETYKIIAPNWTLLDLVVTSNSPPYPIEFQAKTQEEQVCYNSDSSNSIIQTETNDLSEDRVANFKVRTISKSNPIISYRYSILVKQYVQSLEAYSYYNTLNKISNTDSPFSNNQPGFISGNIFSVENSNELILGYFEVTPVNTKRLFFNYSDLFPEEPLPPYFIDCELFAPSNSALPGEMSPLVELLVNEEVKYFSKNPDFPNPLDLNAGPYLVVEASCGDCTKIGSNIVPDFWEE